MQSVQVFRRTYNHVENKGVHMRILSWAVGRIIMITVSQGEERHLMNRKENQLLGMMTSSSPSSPLPFTIYLHFHLFNLQPRPEPSNIELDTHSWQESGYLNMQPKSKVVVVVFII